MPDFMKLAKTALGVSIIGYGMAALYSRIFPNGILNFSLSFAALPQNIQANVGAQISQGVDTTLAGKLLAAFGNLSLGMLTQFATIYIASFLIVYAAMLISQKINIGKSEITRFGASMTLSATLLGLIVGTTSITVGYIGTAIAMFLYFAVIAIIYGQLSKIIGKETFPTA